MYFRYVRESYKRKVNTQYFLLHDPTHTISESDYKKKGLLIINMNISKIRSDLLACLISVIKPLAGDFIDEPTAN